MPLYESCGWAPFGWSARAADHDDDVECSRGGSGVLRCRAKPKPVDGALVCGRGTAWDADAGRCEVDAARVCSAGDAWNADAGACRRLVGTADVLEAFDSMCKLALTAFAQRSGAEVDAMTPGELAAACVAAGPVMPMAFLEMEKAYTSRPDLYSKMDFVSFVGLSAGISTGGLAAVAAGVIPLPPGSTPNASA